MTTTSERLRNVRRVYRHRGEQRTTGEFAYLVYVVLLVVALAAIPLLFGLVGWLSQPHVLHALVAPESGGVIALIAGGVLGLAILVGAVRGPVVLPPFHVPLFTGTDMPRSHALRRAFCGPALALSGGFALIALVVCIALVLEEGASIADSALFVITTLIYGSLVSIGWLVGQRLGRDRAWLFALPVLVVVVLSWTNPVWSGLTPWGWFGNLWPATAGSPWWLAGLLAVTLLGVVLLVPRMLRALDEPKLLRQAHQWQSVVAATGTGDFAAVQMIYRSQPRRGRHWKSVVSAPTMLRFVVSDFFAAARMPARLLAAAAILALGGFAVALAFSTSALPTWPALIGTGLIYGGLGALTGGFRHAAETVSAPALYGYSTARLYVLHAGFPLLMSLLATALGGGLALMTDDGDSTSLFLVAMSAIFIVTVRAYDSVKGPLSQTLLAPIDTPVGDMSGLRVLLWQGDALLLALLVVVIATQPQGLLIGVPIMLVGTLLVLLMAWRRLTS